MKTLGPNYNRAMGTYSIPAAKKGNIGRAVRLLARTRAHPRRQVYTPKGAGNFFPRIDMVTRISELQRNLIEEEWRGMLQEDGSNGEKADVEFGRLGGC